MEPVKGTSVMQKRRGSNDIRKLTSGPGKLCNAFGITTKDSGKDLTRSEFQIRDVGYYPAKVKTSKRVGIRSGREMLWRFYESENKFVSK
jgi:DNA-3-methyladenine glycosylase